MKKLWFGLSLIAVLLLGACGGEETAPKEEPVEKTEEQPKEEAPATSWREQVTAIASSDKSETEKHDEVMGLVMDYKPTEEEIKEFETYIVNEFKSGNYTKDITNHEYMLTNLFQAGVVAEYYEEQGQVPMGEFAFDFLQNTKYTYRGVDAPDSEAVKQNEDQMQKALDSM